LLNYGIKDCTLDHHTLTVLGHTSIILKVDEDALQLLVVRPDK
jgi:hypothetical protein